jgi:hypothetical protein
MTRPVTLTTVVRNPETLPYLLKMTDGLVEAGLLTELRVIDEAGGHDGTTKLRSMLPTDAAMGTRIVVVDLEKIRARDPQSYFAAGASDYRHRSTGFSLVPGGYSVTVAMRGSRGAIIGLEKMELVVGPQICFLRRGRGGGSTIASLAVDGVVAGGLSWRSVVLVWDLAGRLSVTFDTGDTFDADIPLSVGSLSLTVTPPPKASADIVVSSLTPTSLGASDPRMYATYHKQWPEPILNGFEVTSRADIVFIDRTGWEDLVTREDVLPLVVGDATSLGPLRRLGFVRRSEDERDVHLSFLDRSAKVIEKCSKFRKEGNELVLSSDDGLFLISRPKKSLGSPAVICVLSKGLVSDSLLLEKYRSLVDEGPIGGDLNSIETDILAHLDSLVAKQSSKGQDGVGDFLLELVEVLPVDARKKLADLLAR